MSVGSQGEHIKAKDSSSLQWTLGGMSRRPAAICDERYPSSRFRRDIRGRGVPRQDPEPGQIQRCAVVFNLALPPFSLHAFAGSDLPVP